MNEVIHVWDKHELQFELQGRYANPYAELTGWVDLQAPGYSRRCYGFWDGDQRFTVRVTATEPGQWTWRAGSSPEDPGIHGQTGEFAATAWTEDAKAANPCRRGPLRATANGHAFEHADGTPCFLLADTWWAAGTHRFPWPAGATAQTPRTFPYYYAALRSRQGFNCIALIAAFPNWVDDGLPATLDSDTGTVLRRAWPQADTGRAKPMHDELGRSPFGLPGKVPAHESSVPDLDRIEPTYFHGLDRKIDHLNALGIMPFIEVARRDVGQVWQQHHAWPDSYARFVQYVWSRYQANCCLFSPIHYDSGAATIDAPDWNEAANYVIDTFGTPPFGTPVGSNPHGSSLMNFGHTSQARWLTFHQTGNARRDHYSYSLLTEAYDSNPPVPVLNGEPQYEGMQFRQTSGWYFGEMELAAAPGDDAARYVRSAAYGSVLSGGLAGHVSGAGGWDGGIWRGDIEDASPVHVWDAMEWPAAGQMQHLRSFLLCTDSGYQDLAPAARLLTPNRDGPVAGFDGWAYCAASPGGNLRLIYLEQDTPATTALQLTSASEYTGAWLDPRTGAWSRPWRGRADSGGALLLPDKPTHADWALKLERCEPEMN